VVVVLWSAIAALSEGQPTAFGKAQSAEGTQGLLKSGVKPPHAKGVYGDANRSLEGCSAVAVLVPPPLLDETFDSPGRGDTITPWISKR